MFCLDALITMQSSYTHYSYMFVLYHCVYLRRVPVRKDTCGIVAVSINMSGQQYPVIWTIANLPFDCFKALAVPKPLGMFMCIC